MHVLDNSHFFVFHVQLLYYFQLSLEGTGHIECRVALEVPGSDRFSWLTFPVAFPNVCWQITRQYP
jgi:hypothetical protein